jgi:hypothetical protein
MHESRKLIQINTWPDPLIQERIEELGFFWDKPVQSWLRFCGDDEVPGLSGWLKRHHLSFTVKPATGRGELKKHPKLSDELMLRDGGGPQTCALCGARGVPCRQWVEGDDTDSTDYPNAARFYMCGQCVQERMSPHPRLYAPTEDQL